MKKRGWRNRGCRSLRAVAALTVLALVVGCDRLDMYDQPRYKPLAASDFFTDGLSARPRVSGTVARGELHDDEPLYTGKEAGKLVSRIPQAAYRSWRAGDSRSFDQAMEQAEPAELRRALLTRGHERFDIYCSVCHGRTGDGEGMIVRRGFRKPPSLHIERLIKAPAGHFFDIITNGIGAMPSYGNRIDVDDRWAIVAYVRALQLSQNARVADVPDSQRDLLPQSPGQPLEDRP
jgi:mono/diheme cytochrome c family protein